METEMESCGVLEDLTECCICFEVLSNPRMLPCVHVFCLKCLQKTAWYSHREPGDRLPCPICRREFLITNTDFSGLAVKDDSILRLMRIRSTSQERTQHRSNRHNDTRHDERRELHEFYATGSLSESSSEASGLRRTSWVTDYLLPVAVIVLAVGLGVLIISRGWRR